MVDPQVVRLMYFPGSPIPRVEIWTRAGLDTCGKPRYDYTTIGGPVCETDEEWYALLGQAEHFVFERCNPNQPGCYSLHEAGVTHGCDRKDRASAATRPETPHDG